MFEFSSTRLPCTTMSHGHGTIGDIAHRMLWVLILICGRFIDLFRSQVRSWLSDQSTERKLLTSPARILHDVCPEKCMTSVDADSTEPLLPHALEILDHCHILMNALETAVKKLSWWQSMKETSHSRMARDQTSCDRNSRLTETDFSNTRTEMISTGLKIQ